MNKIKINMEELTMLIESVLSEDDLNLVNTNSKYNLNDSEMYQLYQDLVRVKSYLISIEQMIENKPDHNDKINRVKRNLKLLSKKIS